MSRIYLRKERKCDFCGRTEKEAQYIIVAPDEQHDICDVCVETCVEIIAEKRAAEAQPPEKQND